VVVYRCCARLLRDPEDAKDATQEVFIKLLKNVEALEQDEHAVSWVYRVATNHCLNVRRDGARAKPLDPVVDVAGRPQPSYPDLHLARSILSRFDAQTRAIAVGVVVEEMDHEEIADSLGVSKRTVARKLKRFFECSRKFAARTDSGDDDTVPGANT
jgi:RNA polymerase sigma-70 factor (ECF subfamily)